MDGAVEIQCEMRMLVRELVKTSPAELTMRDQRLRWYRYILRTPKNQLSPTHRNC